jgi:hypothetical protein
MGSVHTIKLKNYSDVFEEYTAGGTIYPGMLLLMSAADTVVAHNDDVPVNCLPMFALEDALQGKDIDDPYVIGDPVKVWVPYRGDEVYGILEDGANASVGSFLTSNGAGMLQVASSSEACVGIALESLNLSGSSGVEESSAPWGFAKRIKLKIL